MTVFTKDRHWKNTGTKRIQSKYPSYFLSMHFNIIFLSSVKSSEVSYIEVLGDKSNMYMYMCMTRNR